MKHLLVILLLVVGVNGLTQTNLIFSTSKSYKLSVQLSSYTPVKITEWQTKFNNIPAGDYSISVTVSSSDFSYNRQQVMNLTVG